jgi:phosphomevalonate kinase
MAPTTVVSAPGKVLIAGGYLVLDPLYSGTVVSTSSRFYSAITTSKIPNQIIVSSPQFVNAEWKYAVGAVNNSIYVEAE